MRTFLLSLGVFFISILTVQAQCTQIYDLGNSTGTNGQSSVIDGVTITYYEGTGTNNTGLDVANTGTQLNSSDFTAVKTTNSFDVDRNFINTGGGNPAITGTKLRANAFKY